MSKLGVCLNWPYTMLNWYYHASLFDSDVRKNPNTVIIRAVSTNPACSGNMLVKAALEEGCDEILFIDADQGVPKDVLSRLRAHNKEIVTALTPTRQEGHHWLCFDFREDGMGQSKIPTKPLEKADVGTIGCSLVKASVFHKVPPPWFKATVTPDGMEIIQTSDFYFFRKCKDYGIEVFVDATLESPHMHEIILQASTLGRKLPFLEKIGWEDSEDEYDKYEPTATNLYKEAIAQHLK